MPSLNALHIVERLKDRLLQLKNGAALEARDINALLKSEQQQGLEAAWTEQQEIRKTYKTKANAERNGLTWKTIREVRIDVYKQALADAELHLVDDVDAIQRQSEVNAARVFMDAYTQARDKEKNGWTQGNNALVRAGFSRVDGRRFAVGSKRDSEVREIEAKLLAGNKGKMTAQEAEQLELSNEHDAALAKRRKH